MHRTKLQPTGRIKATLLIATLLFFYTARTQTPLTATMNNVRLEFNIDAKGRPFYSVYYKNKAVILPSKLGFTLQGGDLSFSEGFALTGSTQTSFDSTWAPVWGEVSSIRDHHLQLTFHLKRKTAPFRLLDIEFRIFDDGVGFRYVFPPQPDLGYFIVTGELTQFALSGDHKTFWIPGDYDTNEYPYTTSKISEIDNAALVANSSAIAVRVAPDRYSVQTPLMMKSADGIYLNIHEAALLHYPAMQLHVDRQSHVLTSELVPDAVGNKAYLKAPCHTPWRTILVSDRAADILSSKTILNLNEPSKVENTSWIHPMKFAGVWWEMQTGKSTWSYAQSADNVSANGQLIPSGKHGANTDNVKRYIDFAAANNIKGVLVEGWNVGWEDWFGNWKENVFDFVTPYPDFNVKELTTYAASKGVSLIMHNETSGSATNYERQLDTAFAFMRHYGYHSVKTGYVGRIIPRGEHHDGQWMVEHYERVVQKAIGSEVMVDAHEPVRPTGLQRTYPNWMASEAGRGNEYNAFSDGNEPEHETILPFTRLMGGPMDYTPGIFRIKGYSSVPGRQVHTTLTKQLALYVTLYSPVQMVADLPENYAAKKDAFQFIRDVPVDWDDTRILEAEPGDYLTIARKEKGSANWFLGSITDEHARSSSVKLDFLDAGKKYTATIYRDAANADWKNNPEAYTIEKITVDRNTVLQLKLAPGGGTAVSIIRQ
jgi:hypothetical protein